MQLNIYNISHPIIKLLSNVIKEKKQNPILSSYYYRNIGLFLIYEILRKYITIRKVYIKSICSTKSINLNDNNKRYIILTNLSDNYEMVTDIRMLLPNIDIIDINNDDIYKNHRTVDMIIKQKQNIEVFILQKQLKGKDSAELIQYLISKCQISINHINLACIISYQDILNELSYKYPKLKVYTTEIL